MENQLTRELFEGLTPEHETDRVLSMCMVIGGTLMYYDVYYLVNILNDSLVRIVADPNTANEYNFDINLAMAAGSDNATEWIEEQHGQPTSMSAAIGAAVEFKCRELKNTRA